MVKLVNENTQQFLYAPIGFSWTNFFFGSWVPLFRGEGGYFWLYTILSVFTFGIFNFVMWFSYNKGFIVRKLKQGWIPADSQTQNILLANGVAAGQNFAEFAEKGEVVELKPYKPNRIGFYILLVLEIIFVIISITYLPTILETILETGTY